MRLCSFNFIDQMTKADYCQIVHLSWFGIKGYCVWLLVVISNALENLSFIYYYSFIRLDFLFIASLCPKGFACRKLAPHFNCC